MITPTRMAPLQESRRLPEFLRRLWTWRQDRSIDDSPPVDWPLILFSGLLFALIALATLGPSSYFLHFDTPVQNLAGLLFLKGTWAYTSNKAILMWIHALMVWMVGAHPLNETILLAVLGTAATMALADTALATSGTRRYALLAVLLWLSFSSVLFYLRIHLGYPLAFFTIGLALYLRRRFATSGLAFLLAILAHTTFIVPVGVWLVLSTLTGIGPRKASELVKLLVLMTLGYLAYEYIALRYTTELWYTARSFMREVQNWDEGSLSPQPLYPWLIFNAVNGPFMTGLLALSLAIYPATRKTANRLQDCLWATGLALVIFYFVIRTGMTGKPFLPRLVAGVFPFLAITGASVLQSAVQALSQQRAIIKRVLQAGLSLALTGHLSYVVLGQAACSVTLYPAVQSAFEEAAAQQIPVIYDGNPWVGGYFRELTGAEVLINPAFPPLAFETANTRNVQDYPQETQFLFVTFREPEKELAQLAANSDVEFQQRGDVTMIPGRDECAASAAENGQLAPTPMLTVWRLPDNSGRALYIWEGSVVR